MNKSLSDSEFDLPNIQFNMNDVYSRLFNNVILSQNILKNKIKKQKKENELYGTSNKLEISKNNINTYTNKTPKTKFSKKKVLQIVCIICDT